MANRFEEEAVVKFVGENSQILGGEQKTILRIMSNHPLDYENSSVPIFEEDDYLDLMTINLHEQPGSPIISTWLISHGIPLETPQEESYALKYIQNMSAMKIIQRNEQSGRFTPQQVAYYRTQTSIHFAALEMAMNINIERQGYDTRALSREKMMATRVIVEQSFQIPQYQGI